MRYSYVANSRLPSQIISRDTGAGTDRLIVTKVYDYLNRLKEIQSSSTTIGVVPWDFSYQYNSANQRTRITAYDGSYWNYAYDSLGQVVSGKRYFNDNSPVPGEQYEYGYDSIGNRTSTKEGGDENGLNLRSASYTPNLLNQYSGRTVPNGFDVLGMANSAASVTVGGNTAWRKGEFFRKEATVANSSSAVWNTSTVTASQSGNNNSVTVNHFVPAATESYTYDDDGNLLSDGRWNYTWDAENRLIKQESLAGGPSGSKRRLEYKYDYRHRRIWKKETNLDTSTVVSERRFYYDGWNCIAELDTGNTVVQSYSWGPDLSGMRQGAGGVGGLVMERDSAGVRYFPAYDGSGNVVGLVKASDGTISASYEFDPFGQTIRMTGTQGMGNPFRFSTKYTENSGGLLDYGYRHYNPSSGRWVNRDPIEEFGGLHLYGFAFNQPQNLFDLDGQLPGWLDWWFNPPYSADTYMAPDGTTSKGPSPSATADSVQDYVDRLGDNQVPRPLSGQGDSLKSSAQDFSDGREDLLRQLIEQLAVSALPEADIEQILEKSGSKAVQRCKDLRKGMAVRKAGHHVPAVRKSAGRPFQVGRNDRTRPTIHSRGPDPANDHWRMHNAEREHVGPRQGDFKGTDEELFEAYRKAYETLNDIRVDVKSPDGSTVVGTDVTPRQAIDLIEDWLRKQGQR